MANWMLSLRPDLRAVIGLHVRVIRGDDVEVECIGRVGDACGGAQVVWALPVHDRVGFGREEIDDRIVRVGFEQQAFALGNIQCRRVGEFGHGGRNDGGDLRLDGGTIAIGAEADGDDTRRRARARRGIDELGGGRQRDRLSRGQARCG